MREILLATIPATIPTLAVLVGILLNQTAYNRLHAEVVVLRKQLHDDIVMLVGRDTDKSERLARLEERTKSN